MSHLNGLEPVVLILAAGRGERFRAAGGVGHKLDALLTTAGKTRRVLDHVMDAAQDSGLPWHVVLPAHTAHLAEQGMGTSIATGVAATADASGWLILPGDLPLISGRCIRSVADALRHHCIVVPHFQDMQGHPVGFARRFRQDLLGLSGDGGARGLFVANPPHRIQVEDDGCTWDVDTPESLRQACIRASAG